MNYAEISKETMTLLYQCRSSLEKSPLSATIRALAELRTSQINECAYCCRLHTNEARKLGISQEKLDVLPAWRHSTAFTNEEKLALEWTESVTLLDSDSSEIKEQLKQTYSEREIVDLTLCISIMNSLNRIVTTLRD